MNMRPEDRAIGMNLVALTGLVGDQIRYDERPARKQDACSFTVAIHWSHGTTFVRVNVYGSFVETCREKLRNGVRVEVQGELMNRRASDEMFTEVRCKYLNVI